MKKEIIQSIKIITLGVILAAGTSLAWNTPQAGPSAGDAEAPIHKGAAVQTKRGPLGITGALHVYGYSQFQSSHISIFGQPPSGGGGGGSESAYEPSVSNSKKFSSLLKSFWNSSADSVSSFSLSAEKALAVPPETPCTDGLDNNNDGPIDCADASCANDPACYVPPPTPIAPQISYFYADSNYGSGTTITVAQNDNSVFLQWEVDGTLPMTCTKSASPSTSEWTGSATFYGQDWHLTSLSTNATRTYTLSCSNSVGSQVKTVTVNSVAPPPTSDLFVTGSIGLAVATPTQKIDALASMYVKSLASGSDHRICATSTGKIVLCPKGTISVTSDTKYSAASNTWTVPDGVYRISLQVKKYNGSSFTNVSSTTSNLGGYNTGTIDVIPSEVLNVVTKADEFIFITY